MKIKKIKLTAYKRFNNLTIDLGNEPKRIIALIGPNGCGKSSVFDGISYLCDQYGVGYGSNTRIPNNYHKRYKDVNVDSNSIQIEFDKGNYLSVLSEFRRIQKGNTLFAFRSPYRYTSSLKIKELKSIPQITTNTNGAKFSFDLDDKMTNNFQLFYTKINQYLKDNPDKATYNEAINYYLKDVNESLMKCLNIKIAQVGEITIGDGTFYFKKNDQDEYFDYNLLSSGEKEVVDMLIDIVVKKDDFNDSIYIFDEPELHINSSIQRKLLKEIDRLIPENCQIWVATHSIGFLRALEEDFIHDSQIIKFNGDYAKRPVTLFPMERNRNNFLELYQTAVDDIATLIAPKQIIYCEGKITREEQGLDEYCYNYIFNHSHPDTLFISSGGCSELNKYSEIALMLINKAFFGVNILKLKDRDINGNSANSNITTQDDRDIFLAKDPNNRMLKRLEIENYLLDYEIVSTAYPEITKEMYDSIITDIVNQDLKGKIKELIKICNRKNERNFNKEKFLKSLVPYINENTNVYKDLENEIFKN